MPVDFYPAKAQLEPRRANTCMNEKWPVSFPGWKSALALSNLTPVVKSSHLTEIISFLHHLKTMHSPATVVSIKQWLDDREPRIASPAVEATGGPARMALRWFYRSAPKEADTEHSPAAIDKSRGKPAPTVNALENPAGEESGTPSSALGSFCWSAERSTRQSEKAQGIQRSPISTTEAQRHKGRKSSECFLVRVISVPRCLCGE